MRLKQGFILFAILATLLCAGCQGTTTPPPSTQPSSSPSEPPISFFLEVTEPQDEAVVDTSPIRVSGSTSPCTTVSVSGTLIDVNAHGNFAATIELEETSFRPRKHCSRVFWPEL